MSIPLIELTDDFSTWRDNFNLTVDKVNELDANDSSLPLIETDLQQHSVSKNINSSYQQPICWLSH